MGQMVEFASNGKTAQGYLAAPEGTGPGVIVIQEWWGLVDHVKDLCDRFAREGFVALAPDLYHGKSTKEPTEAGKLMMEMQIDQAARDLSGAYDFLIQHQSVQPKKVGATGFCMGGLLALYVATLKPVAATVPFYGVGSVQPDWSALQGPVLGHYAEHDDFASPEKSTALFDELAKHTKAELHIYPGTSHAFFNDTRADVYAAGAATQAWQRTIDFFRANLS